MDGWLPVAMSLLAIVFGFLGSFTLFRDKTGARRTIFMLAEGTLAANLFILSEWIAAWTIIVFILGVVLALLVVRHMQKGGDQARELVAQWSCYLVPVASLLTLLAWQMHA